MKLDAFTRSNAIPAWHLLRTSQNQQQSVMSVGFGVPVAAILWGVTLPVRRHPDLQASHSLRIMVELLQCSSDTKSSARTIRKIQVLPFAMSWL